MGVQKMLKRGAAVALCGALLAQPCLVAVSQAKDSTVLYTVNCGTPDPSVVPNGYSLGACQSRVDQAWGGQRDRVQLGLFLRGPLFGAGGDWLGCHRPYQDLLVPVRPGRVCGGDRRH